MAEYDGSIRINTEIETSGVKKDVAEIQREIENLKNAQKSFLEAGGSKTSPVYVEYEKSIEKAQKSLEELEKTQRDIESQDEHWNLLKVDVEEYAKALKELERQGKYFGDEDYDRLYLAWKNASDAVKAYRNELNQQSAVVREVLNEQAAEENRLSEIKNNAAVSDEKMVALLEKRKALADQLKELEKAGVGEGYKEYDQTYIAWKNATDALKEYQSQLNQQTESGQAKAAEQAAKAAEKARVEAEKQEAAQRKIEEQAERTLQKENARIQKEIENEARLQEKEAEKAAIILAQEEEEDRLRVIKSEATAVDQQIIDLLERRKQVLLEIKDLESAGVGYGYQEYDSLQKELSGIDARLRDYKNNLTDIPEKFKAIKTSAENSFKSINNAVKKSNGSLSVGFKTILKYGFGIRSIYALFNKIRTGIKEGFSNLIEYSSDFANSVQGVKNSLGTLGNQMAAAFAPIVQMVIPWLTSLINAISTAMTYVAQFIAILGGKSTFTKAKQVQDGYNKSLTGTASAAKKAYGALAKFDDLDVLQKQESDSAGSGDGGAATNLFEEIPVDPALDSWLDGILEKLAPILDYLKELKDVFLQGFWDGLGDYEYRFDAIKTGLEQIKKALIDIWTDPAVLSAADNWLRSIVYLFGSIAGSVASVGLTIAAAFIGGVGQYLENNTERIKKFLVSAFNIGAEINYTLADLFQSVAYIFEALASESGIRFVAALIGSIVDAGMGILEVALKLGRDILEMLIRPITENNEGFRTAFEGLLSSAASILEGFKGMIDSIFDNLNAVYDAHIKPFFENVTQHLTELVGNILNVWNGTISPILQRIGESIGKLLSEYIAPFVNSVVEFVGNLITILQSFWDACLWPIVNGIITYVVPVLAEIIGGFIEFVISFVESLIMTLTIVMNFLSENLVPTWQAVWETAGNVLETFSALAQKIGEAVELLFGGMIETIRLAIEGDWKGAWENAQNVIVSFKEKVKEIIDIVRGILESFFSWIGEAISNVLNAISSIGSSKGKISASGSTASQVFGASRAAVSSYSFEVPALASGSVIRGGNPFLALLGDQPSGQTNIEAPLATIVDAFEGVLSRNGYGGSVPLVVNLNYDGETFARLSLNDIFAEATRQGYDLSVLGVT